MPTATEKRDSLVLLFTMTFPCVMAWLYFVVLPGAESGANPVMQAAFGVGKFVMALVPLVYVLVFERERIKLKRPTAAGLALAVLFGIIVAASTVALYGLWLNRSPLLVDTPARVLRMVRAFGITTPAGYIGMGFFICVVHSLFEEYYWRWFVFGTLKRYLPVATAITLSSFGFMLHHVVILGVYFPGRFWTLALPFSICVTVGGGVWAWIYHKSGSIYAAWLSHALIDAAILLVGFDMIQGHLGPTLWDAAPTNLDNMEFPPRMK